MGLFLYNLLLPVYLVIALPGLLVKMRRRGGYGANFKQRFGRYDQALSAALIPNVRPWWIHAVSVGEVLVALKLIEAIQKEHPEQMLVLSTTSSTGHATAKDKAPTGVHVIYNPLDLPGIVERVLRKLNPSLIVLMESELWPNLIATAEKRHIPVVIANARLSPRSAHRYTKFRALASPTLNRLTAVLTQEPQDGPRWEATGLQREKIHCTGSIKFDPAVGQDPLEEQLGNLRSILTDLWGNLEDKHLVLLGSSHAGEELAVAKIFAKMKVNLPQLRLLLVPRHFERANDILAELERAGLSANQRSAWPTRRHESADILLVDSTGELRTWYALVQAVIVGKSFLGEGGQNPVEPILAGCPVVVGPHMENFAALTELLTSRSGLEQISSLETLEGVLCSWVQDPQATTALVKRGQEALSAHAGATNRTLEKLLAFQVDSASVRN
ncbi:MAG: hypothetical protein GWQ05_03145 [Verrucomicrobiaceae bacterium]|nr:hypothetical protein [Verrucomicrobiaceae bacterium]